jgi:ribosomal RNA-processing protein 17
MESMLQPGIFNHPRQKRSLLPPLSHKKRKIEHKIEEINFDDEKRADYLTGFHKRKVARAKQAQLEAEKMAREERVKFRKQVGLIYSLMEERLGLG